MNFKSVIFTITALLHQLYKLVIIVAVSFRVVPLPLRRNNCAAKGQMVLPSVYIVDEETRWAKKLTHARPRGRSQLPPRLSVVYRS